MALIKRMTISQCVELARASNRAANFGGYYGWRKMFEYLEDSSDSIGEDIEIDIVAICCDYSHAGNIEEFLQEYDKDDIADDFDSLDENEQLSAIEEFINHNSSVVCVEADCIIWSV